MTETATQASTPLPFDPFSPEFARDPYPFYALCRENTPLLELPFGWLVFRHADVTEILKDRRFGHRYVETMSAAFGPELLEEPLYQMMRSTMLIADPPDHTRLRGLVAKAFTARRVESMRPRIRQIVDELIDRVEPEGGMDVVRQFAHALPVIVICDMLGIPESDRAMFLESSRVTGRVVDPTPMTPEEIARGNENTTFLFDYFGRLFDLRRREPGDDLCSALVAAEQDEGRLSALELAANVQLLFAAGHETTANLIGNGLLALHRHPDQLARLKAEPELMPNAIEELLRFDSSVQLTSRRPFEAVAYRDIRFEDHQMVYLMLAAANRDPAVWTDPDRLDVARPGVKAISFGGGLHHCLGAQLARIEGEEAFGGLLRRLPDLRLQSLDNLQWRPTFTLRGLTALNATW